MPVPTRGDVSMVSGSWRTWYHRHRALGAALTVLAPLLLGCGLGGNIVVVTPTPPHPTATPAPPPHVISWVQQDGGGNAQIWASINDGPATQITHQEAPGQQCLKQYGSPMFSPDLKHIVFADYGCTVDSQIFGALFVADATNGALTQVPLPNSGSVITNQRSYGWINNTSLFAIGSFGNGPGAATYSLGANTATPLPGFPGNGAAQEGVVRGTTLWYVTGTQAYVSGYQQMHAELYRYDLNNHNILPSPIDLGSWGAFPGSPGDYHLQGWDVSPDGTHVVYQSTTPQPFQEVQGGSGVKSQSISYANDDGSGASQIVQYMTTNALVRIRFSPDGRLVGITEAHGTPDVLTGCVNSPGLKNDPCLQFYTPDATGYPAWHWNSSYMVTTGAPANQNNIGALNEDTPGHFNASTFAASGYSPWSTP